MVTQPARNIKARTTKPLLFNYSPLSILKNITLIISGGAD
ncbi:Uncharacterized protein dnm_073090 [Desulfonema magnum]|uniref:Uncharacterized protein n=1 Tax=Desulfonema magnum TaxID=45655 RepID=A0A975GRS4_9BACT|nr:Uncharacterized protein dnm_073090 [Desulfonema magnum]